MSWCSYKVCEHILRSGRGCTNPPSKPKGKGHKGYFIGQASSELCEYHHCWEWPHRLSPSSGAPAVTWEALGEVRVSASLNMEVIMPPGCVTMRLHKVRGSKEDRQSHPEVSDGQPASATPWPRAYQSQRQKCVSHQGWPCTYTVCSAEVCIEEQNC